MATFYLDPENGNDANNGTTFANRWKSLLNGATAARIGPGDIIRVISGPEPTLVGNASWNRHGLGPSAGSISAVSNTTPIQITTSAAHNLVTGDVVNIISQTGNRYINGSWVVTVVDATRFTLDSSVAAGAGGTATGSVIKATNKVIVLDTPVTKTIDMCEVAWTASTNVTATAGTTGLRQGMANANLSIAAAFTTGKVAYRALPATIDLSAYSRISLHYATSAAYAGGNFTLRLCSDAIGNTAVNTFTLPASPTTTTTFPIVLDNGGPLGSSIASIAVYAASDPGTIVVRLDCIIACKAAGNDALTLLSLVGKNRAGDAWYSVSTIEDRVINLDSASSSAGTAFSSAKAFAWWEDTENVSLYKREPLLVERTATNVLTVNEGDITISGGWNRTDMSTQSGETWLDCGRYTNGLIIGTAVAPRDNVTVEDIAIVRGFSSAIEVEASDNITFNNVSTGACADGVRIRSSASHPCRNIRFLGTTKCIGHNQSVGVAGIGITDNSTGGIIDSIYIEELFSHGCNGAIWFIGSAKGKIDLLNSYAAFSAAIIPQGTFDLYIEQANIYDSVSGYAIYSQGTGTSPKLTINNLYVQDTNTAIILPRCGIDLKIRNYSDIGLTTFLTYTGALGPGVQIQNFDSSFSNLFTSSLTDYSSRVPVSLGNYGGVSTDHRIYFIGSGNVRSETSVRHTASGYAWKMTPESTNVWNQYFPQKLLVGKVYVEANKLVTVTGWVRRTHTDIKIGLIAEKGQLAGMTVDYSDEITAAIDTWEQLSFTFTPTEAGVVEVHAYCYGSLTESGYVDDIEISQAA